ncbi:MAG: glycosyltransferase family 39 protein [bacterium]|nr:glycosyltransferase family 39 protein [bacterium]
MTGHADETLFGWHLTRTRAWAIVVLIWAIIYLPALGALELRGNEAKRVLPALEMLDGGSLITPQLAGERYYNKPPLMYWMIAGAMQLTGTRSEWAARIPSVLAVLVFVTVLLWRGDTWLSLRGRLCAALIFMTVVSFIEKGRSSEIEAAFVAVTGCGVWWWLTAWDRVRGKSDRACTRARLQVWLPVAAIIGIGLLLKGPLLLVFVYVPVLCVLVYEKRVRELLTWQHGLACVIWAGMLLAWVLACKWENPHASAHAVWRAEIGSRFVPDDFRVLGWLGAVLKVPIDFLPWSVCLPLLWWPVWTRAMRVDEERVFRALRAALVIGFALVNLLPGTRPRYSMPLFANASILLGWVLTAGVPGNAWCAVWARLVRAAALVWIMAGGVALALGPSGVAAELLRVLALPVHVPAPATAKEWLITLGAVVVIWYSAGWLWRHGERLRTCADCVVATSGLIATGVLACTTFVFPFFTCNATRRPAGAAIAAVLPTRATLHVYARPDLRESGYQPFLYYVPRPLVFLTNIIQESPSPYVLMADHHTDAWLIAYAAQGTPLHVLTNFVFKDDRFSVLGPRP